MDKHIIEKIYTECKPHFVDHNIQRIHVHPQSGLVPLLIDSGSNRIIGSSRYYLSIESMLNHNTIERNSFHTKNISDNLFVDSDKIWTIKFNKFKDCWEADYNFSSEDSVFRYIFMNQQLKAIDIVNDIVCVHKARVTYKLPYEQYIFAGKVAEVKEILSNNIENDPLNHYPITNAYARYRNISLIEAANEYDFHLKNEFVYLGELEYVRLRYSEMISKETDFSNLNKIMEDLHNEMYGYSRFGVS
jgi:hypothetical protein